MCPQDSTNRSRPGQWVSLGLCRITFWNSKYATGARLIAVPGWPLPTCWTASAASTRDGVDGSGVEIGPPLREDCARDVCVGHTHVPEDPSVTPL